MEAADGRRCALLTLWNDLRYGIRILAKNPGFTLVAVLTLALGIGANAAIFSVVNAVLLDPLPYKNDGQLINLTQTNVETKDTGIFVSLTKLSALRKESRTLDGLAAYYPIAPTVTGNGEPEIISGSRVTANFFHTLGVAPALGRDFALEEEVPGGGDVAIVTDGFWHNHFGGDSGLLGRSITLDGKSVTVVGILPAYFRFPFIFPENQVYMPRVSDPPQLTEAQVHSGAGYLGVIGRLRDGQTLAQAQTEFAGINERYRQQFAGFADASRFVLAATSLADSLLGTLKISLFVLMAAVGFVLLIACANVAGLLLARAKAREKEIAIRKALGASGMRLIRQFVSESLLLSFVGGTLGVVLCYWLMPLLRFITPGTIPRLEQTTVNGTVLLFSLGLCCLTTFVFGLVPMLQGFNRNLHDTLKEGGRGTSPGTIRKRFRKLIVAAEVAAALILMTGAGLLIRSFVHLLHVDPGFQSKNVMTFPIALPLNRYDKPAQAEFYRLLQEKVKVVPGVESASLTNYLPLSGAAHFVYFCPEGRVCQGVGKDPLIAQRQVTPDYFETIRTPLLRGRVFSAFDTANGQPVAIVSKSTADRYWPDQNPVGKHVVNPRDNIQREVVGVVATVKFNSLSAPNFDELYLPLAQNPWPTMTLLVRSQLAPQAVVTAVRQKIAELDPNLAITGILSLDGVVASSVAQPRLTMQLAGALAALALLLSAVGIYGVMAYAVVQRSREMGIRMAIGAQPRDIMKLVLGDGLKLALAGVTAGVIASLFLTRLLATLLFGVGVIDPLTLASVIFLVVGTTLLACYVPARRGMRVDPILVLREE
jgi:putative ABC transport system permease protein